MRCLLITVKRNRRGQPVREGRIISGDSLSVGRGSDCAIYLPNARVNLLHATLRTQDDGRLVIEANSTPLGVNGTFTQRARLRPDTRIAIGPYQLVVELAGAEGYAEHDFALTVEQRDVPADGGRGQRRRLPTTLAQTWLSRRVPAILLACLVGVLFLVFPILHATQVGFRAAEARGPLPTVPADLSWNPGPLADGHRGFGSDCKSCHTVAFEHVQDRECASCHETTGPHIRDAALQGLVFGSTRCAECHRDHRGRAGMNDIDPVLCGACHGSIRQHALGSTLPDISDFKKAHPPFKLSIQNGPLKGDIVRVDQSEAAPIRQNTGLKFPHDVHLSEDGVESHDAPPGQKGRVVLGCADCHAAEASGVGFKPVSMKEHCANCHRLEFDPDVTSRQVPHGSERNVLLMLREFYASEALGTTPIEVTTVDGLLQRPGRRPGEVRQRDAARWASERAERVATDLFEVRVCIVCHEVKKNPDRTLEKVAGEAPIAIPWKITPVFITQHWMPKARFEHARHKAVECVDCHAVTLSKKSSDVAMPSIAKCRECHVGSEPERHKISSNCEMCHGFHRDLPATDVAAATTLAPLTDPLRPLHQDAVVGLDPPLEVQR